MNLNKYLVTAHGVSRWDDRDQRDQMVANNINRIYHALDLRIGPILITGDERHWNEDLYHKIMGDVRGDWSCKIDKLLNITDEQIQEYVEFRATDL